MSDRELVIHAYQLTKRATYLDFDGSSDYVSIPNLGYTGDYTFTVEAWVNIDTVNGDGTTFFAIGPATSSNGVYWAYTTTTNLRFAIWGIEDVNLTVPDPTTLGWFHLACVYDSTLSKVFVYYNGYLQASSNVTNNPNLSNSNYNIGRVNNGSATAFFDGKMSEFRFWYGGRTQGEISSWMNQSLITYTGGSYSRRSDLDEATGSVKVYYPIVEGTGTSLTDYSKNGNTGTLNTFSGSYWLTATPPRVYDRTYRGHNSKFIFSGLQENINSGSGSIDFTLPDISDVSGNSIYRDLDGVELQLDLNTDTGTQTLFRGISRVVEYRPKNSKTVKVQALGVTSELTSGYTLLDYDGTYNTVMPASGTQSIEACFKDVIYSYNSQNPLLPLKFTSTSLEATGKNITTTFYSPQNIIKVFNSLWKQTDSNWIWYIDSDNVVYLKAIPTTADYIFTYNKDFILAEKTDDATKIVNRARISNGTVMRGYKNSTSIDTYGQREEVIWDNRLSTAGMDEQGQRIVDGNSTPNVQLRGTILDVTAGGTYNIFEGLIGKVFSVANTDEILTNYVISSARLYPQKGYAEIVANDRELFVSRELYALKEQQYQTNFDNSSPDTCTEV